METTVSVQNSGSFNDIQIEHDNREYDSNGQPYFSKNVDVSMSKDNWYWSGNMTIKEFYQKEFQPAYDEQTEKIRQGHPERLEGRKATYYEEVLSEQLEAERQKETLKEQGMKTKDINKRMSATTKLAYQTIVQLGDRDSIFGTLNGTAEGREIAKQVMREFVEKWQRDHPQMKLINVAIHCDEIGRDGKGGTVHMHITYCPVCQSYKKGMKKRNSLTGALREMGYEADKKKDPETGEFKLAVEKWQHDLRGSIEKIMERYDLTRLAPADTRTGHESIEDYGKRRDQAKKVEENIQQIAEQKQTISNNNYMITQQNKVMIENTDKIADEKKRIDLLGDKYTDFSQVIDETEQKVIKHLIPKEPPPITYETVERREGGLFGKKKNYYLIPQEDYHMMEKQSFFNPERMVQKIQSAFQEVRGIFNQLPIVQHLQQTISKLNNSIATMERERIEKERKIAELEKALKQEKEKAAQVRKEYKWFCHWFGGEDRVKKIIEKAMEEQTREQQKQSYQPQIDDEPYR